MFERFEFRTLGYEVRTCSKTVRKKIVELPTSQKSSGGSSNVYAKLGERGFV